MLETRVIPCLLAKDGRLVKTVRFKNAVYVGDPVNAIKIYNEKEVDELILVDIMATREGHQPSFELIREVANECFMPLCYGGGVTTADQVKRIFGLGIEKVAINSEAFVRPDLISEAADRFGSQSIVVSIDVKKGLFGKYEVRTRGGTRSTGKDPVTYAREMERRGAGEILLTSIDRDGTWAGYDLELVAAVTEAVGIPVIACGGAGSIQHFADAVRQGGASAVAAGSMVVFQGQDLGVLINFPPRPALEAALRP